ncbi:phage minor structural protein [Cytobacillus horneckiae]|uniref:phage tail spike protein n=1 Tax=Cytobacillus horneckiae TaxID=549687 RepID=UPI0019D0C938|nr:phage tail spike protein [Cytobacillus horneckiae]MBN6886250.1 phage tail protein [Cytobacillus horneckiae]
MIHILDKQTDTILAFLNKELTAADHDENLNHEETFDFTVRVGEKSQFIKDRNRAIIPVEDGSFREFIIINTQTNSSSVYAKGNASYLDLDKQRVIEPGIIEGQTLESISNRFLTGTEWELGKADFSGSRKVTIENHIGVFQALKQLCTLFDVEMRFRVEVKGNRIAGRFVDFYKKRGQFRGKEVVFGKDLIEIRRIEDSQNIVTALFCIGPEKEDGSRITTIVKDEDALQRWGRNGRHLWSVYEPESTDTEMSLSRLTQLGNMELKKRINSLVKYETTQAVLDSIKELNHEKVFIADTLRIKDEHFTPPLYAEARVHQVRRSLLDKSKKDYVLGDFIQYTKDEVRKRFKELQKLYGVKVIKSQTPPPGKYGAIWIDTSGDFEIIKTWNGVSWVPATPTRAEEIGAINVEDAKDMVDRGKQEAIDESVNIAIEQDRVIQWIIEQQLAEESERLLAEATTKVNGLREEVTLDMDALNVKAENLVSRVDAIKGDLDAAGGRITSLLQITNDLTGQVSTISTEINEIDGTLIETRTEVNQLAQGLSSKAEKTVVDTLTGNVSSISSQVNVIAGQLTSKAEKSEVYTKTETDSQLGQKVSTTTYNNKVSQLEQNINGLTTRVSSTETTINQQTGEVNTAKENIATLQQTAQGFETRVSSLETDLSNISGGYNLIQNSQFRGGFAGWVQGGSTWFYDEQFKLLDENTARFTYNTGTYPMIRSVMIPVENTELIGKKVTLSVYIFVPAGLKFAAQNHPYIEICGYEDPNSSTNSSFQSYHIPDTIERDKWVRISVTATIRKSVGPLTNVKYIAGLLRFNAIGGVTPIGTRFWYGLPQMEIGGIATNWTPSPKDISNRVEMAESQILIQAGQISSKVSSTDYTGNKVASMINQTATTIKIAAERIDLVGKVTAEMLNVTELSAITARLGNISTGTLNGVTLNSVNINTDRDLRVGNAIYLGERSMLDKYLYFNEAAYFKVVTGGARLEAFASNFTFNAVDSYIFNLVSTTSRFIIQSQGTVNSTIGLRVYAPAQFYGTVFMNNELKMNENHIGDVQNIYTLGDRIRFQKGTGFNYIINDSDSFEIQSGGSKFGFGVDNTGPRIWSMSVYNRPYGSASNVHITEYGTFGRSTSASKYKLNIQEAVFDYKAILKLRPKKWYDKAVSETIANLLEREANGEIINWDAQDIPNNNFIYGLIAEDLVEVGLGQYVEYKRDGEIENIFYDRAWTPLIPIVDEHENRIEVLENEVAALKEEVAFLKSKVA